MAGRLAARIPIVFGLWLDLNEEITHNNATDTTQGQLQLIHGQMAALQHQLAALPEMQQQLAAQEHRLIALQQQLSVVVNRTL